METLNPKQLLEKINVVFDRLKCAAKLNIAFEFVLKNVEEGGCRCRYAHEKRTLLAGSKLEATTGDLTKVKHLLSNTDVNESYTRDRANTKLTFYKLTNVKVFAALLKEILMGCKDTVLPNPLLKNHSVKCLTFGENTRKL